LNGIDFKKHTTGCKNWTFWGDSWEHIWDNHLNISNYIDGYSKYQYRGKYIDIGVLWGFTNLSVINDGWSMIIWD
jgi:hypothetical protein